MRTENRTQAFEWYHFQLPSTTPNADFKVKPLSDADYLETIVYKIVIVKGQ